MCKEMKKMCEEVREETTKKVREETEKKEREKVIRNMLTGPFTKEQIKLALNVTDADIQKVEEELLVHN